MRMVLGLAGIPIGPVEWVTPLGEFSGAQLAGIWLGVSPLFQTLGGIVEIAAGLLLLGRKTTTSGAMIAVGAFTNSLLLHLCFRPSPWISDTVLLALSAYLVLRDARVLVNLFLLDCPTTPLPMEFRWETARTRGMGTALKGAFLLFCLYFSGFQMLRLKHEAEAQSDLSGAYLVKSFSSGAVDAQHHWQFAAIDRYAERLTVRTADGAGETFRVQTVAHPGTEMGHREHVMAIASSGGRLALVAPDGSTSALSYSRTSSGTLELTGQLGGATITVELQLISPNSLPFVNNELYYPQPS
jgi:hypothetical protein